MGWVGMEIEILEVGLDVFVENEDMTPYPVSRGARLSFDDDNGHEQCKRLK
jgi:hypothetical protein